MGKLSDSLHNFPDRNFPFTGDLNKDIDDYIKHRQIPLYNQDLDENKYVFILYCLSFGKNVTVHTLTDGVIEKIKHTKIENMPNEIPKFMKRPFLIEARHDKMLFNDIQSIGGFIYNNEMFLLIGTQGDRYYCQREKASFDGRKIGDINFVYNANIDYGAFIQLKTRKDTFAFATTLSLMLEAEKSPLIIENKLKKSNRKSHNMKNKIHETDWIIKRIYIDRKLIYKKTFTEHNELDKYGKILKDVIVKGHLRKQRYGKDFSEEKWIYIESFESTRWAYEKDNKIIVDKYDKK
jgi:hypothetical protein